MRQPTPATTASGGEHCAVLGNTTTVPHRKSVAADNSPMSSVKATPKTDRSTAELQPGVCVLRRSARVCVLQSGASATLQAVGNYNIQNKKSTEGLNFEFQLLTVLGCLACCARQALVAATRYPAIAVVGQLAEPATLRAQRAPK